MENLQLTARQKNIALIIIIIITVFFSYLILNAIDNTGKHNLRVLAVPSDSKITINNIQSSNQETVPSGEYIVTVAREGFMTDTQTVMVDKDFEIGALLRPLSDDAKKWSIDHNDQYPEGYDYTNDQQPILNYLPYSNYIYSIDPVESSTTNPPLKLNVQTLPGYYNAPIDKIRSMGFNPEDYLYNFNYKDPF